MTTSLSVDINNNLGVKLASLRPHLLRFAMHKVHDRALAEDLVHDVMLAALEAPNRFKQGSSLSTYLIGILKFKLIDNFRYEKKFASQFDPHDADEYHSSAEVTHQRSMYGISGGSLDSVLDPEQMCEMNRSFEKLTRALEQLPIRSARALTLFDYLGFDADEICQDLALSKNHLMVILHRARHTMRGAILLG